MILDYALISLMVLGAVIASFWTLRNAYQGWREQFTENARVSLEDMFLFGGLILTGGGRYSLDQLLFKGKF